MRDDEFDPPLSIVKTGHRSSRSLGDWLAVLVFFVVVEAMLVAGNVAWPALFTYGLGTSLALSSAWMIAGRSTRRRFSIPLGFMIGVSSGYVMNDPCTPIGMYAGPLLGFLTMALLRPRAVVSHPIVKPLSTSRKPEPSRSLA